jgi:hypothetical protein
MNNNDAETNSFNIKVNLSVIDTLSSKSCCPYVQIQNRIRNRYSLSYPTEKDNTKFDEYPKKLRTLLMQTNSFQHSFKTLSM